MEHHFSNFSVSTGIFLDLVKKAKFGKPYISTLFGGENSCFRVVTHFIPGAKDLNAALLSQLPAYFEYLRRYLVSVQSGQSHGVVGKPKTALEFQESISSPKD